MEQAGNLREAGGLFAPVGDIVAAAADGEADRAGLARSQAAFDSALKAATASTAAITPKAAPRAAANDDLKKKALAALDVQVKALVEAAGKGDLASVAVAVGGVVSAAQQVLAILGLGATLDLLSKPLDLSKVAKDTKLPGFDKLPKLEFPKIPGLPT
jgi:hypothetical protein